MFVGGFAWGGFAFKRLVVWYLFLLVVVLYLSLLFGFVVLILGLLFCLFVGY